MSKLNAAILDFKKNFANEKQGKQNFHGKSYVENCETGAVGRMLANLGLAGTAVASAGEVSNAIDGSLRIALKQLEQVTSTEQYKSWLTKNQTDMKSLSSSNPDAYKDFITDFTEIKNKLVTKGVIQNGGK